MQPVLPARAATHGGPGTGAQLTSGPPFPSSSLPPDPFSGAGPDDLRQEAEAAEADAVMAWRRGRSLVDVATDLAHRSRVVAVVAGGRRLTGQARGAGDGILVLDLADGRAGIRLAATAMVRDAGPGSRAEVLRVGTWRSWLYELEGRQGVEIGRRDDAGLLPAVIEAVASDHLLLRTSTGEVFVAMDHLAVVVVRGDG